MQKQIQMPSQAKKIRPIRPMHPIALIGDYDIPDFRLRFSWIHASDLI